MIQIDHGHRQHIPQLFERGVLSNHLQRAVARLLVQLVLQNKQAAGTVGDQIQIRIREPAICSARRGGINIAIEVSRHHASQLLGRLEGSE
jgi:hypothetical protein